MSSTRFVGQRIERVDGMSKVLGTARYVEDIQVPGMLHAALARSLSNHAVATVDEGPARAAAGVEAVLSSLTIEAVAPGTRSFDPACHDFERDPAFEPHPGDCRLLGRRVRYVGEPVAAVAARTRKEAQAAASRVDVGYQPLGSAVTIEDAMSADAMVIHDSMSSNVADTVRVVTGDPGSAFADADRVLERRFATPRQKQCQLEPTGCLVIPTPDGRIDVWTPHQAPHRARSTLAHLFSIPESRLRVVNPEIGGAFGKGDALTAEPYALALSLVTERPVRLVFDRTEDFVGTESRHPMVADVSIALSTHGVITGFRARCLVDCGAYRSHSPRVLRVIANQFLQTYDIANADIEVVGVFTNTPVAGAFRGYGGPQSVFALEHMMDLGAREMGADPFSFRQRHRMRDGISWGPQSRPLDLSGFDETLRVASEAFGWGNPVDPPPERHLRRGRGMAMTAWKSGIAGKPGSIDLSGATVCMNLDGTVDLRVAAIEMGTGIRTTLAQICADTLGVDVGNVRTTSADSGSTPFDSGAHASRSLYRCGQAVVAAARRARDRLLEIAADHLEVDTADLTADAGLIFAIGAPGYSISIADIVRKALMRGFDIVETAYTEFENAPTYAVHCAEVDIDVATGEVTVNRMLAVQDVGRAINPTIVEGQIEGATHQGLGFALTEELIVDEGGVLMNGNLMDYAVMYAGDGPSIEVCVVECPDPTGPFGAKGAGEPSIMLPAPAVANAVLDAVGLSITTLPVTPERVLSALAARDGGKGPHAS